MTRVLVTGSTGLLGSRLCARLQRAGGCEILATARRTPTHVPAASFRACDLTDRVAVDALLDWARPAVILHTAAMTHVDTCERDPTGAFQANTQATAWLALGGHRWGAHLVYVSTDYIFDGRGEPPAEDHPPDPIGVYGATKLMAEQAVRALAGRWAIARVCILFGWPPSTALNFGAWLVQELSAGRPVRLFVDQEVTPTWVDNAAAMVAELGLARHTGVWHTAGADRVTRHAFGLALCRLMGYDSGLIVPVEMAQVALTAPRPLHAGLSTAKAATLLTGKPLSLVGALTGFAATVRAAQEPPVAES